MYQFDCKPVQFSNTLKWLEKTLENIFGLKGMH